MVNHVDADRPVAHHHCNDSRENHYRTWRKGPLIELPLNHRIDHGISVYDEESNSEDACYICDLCQKGELVLACAEVVGKNLGPELFECGPHDWRNPDHVPAGVACDQPYGPCPCSEYDAVCCGNK